MPPKKKASPNGFFFYMKELQDKWKDNGNKMSMKDLAVKAHPSWKALPESKQKIYCDMAKAEKKTRQKLDSFGVPIERTIQLKKDAEDKQQNMLTEIKKIINNLRTTDDVIAQEFYIMSFQCLCKTDERVYIPVEIGLVKFSIKKGICEEYQKFIDAGEIPQGYRYVCLDLSQATHGIPIEDFILASKDYQRVFRDVKEFLRRTKYVYAYPDDMEQTEKCLKWLQEKSGDVEDLGIRVYDLVYLLQELRQVVDDRLTEGAARDLLTRPTYDYVANIGCSWHDEQDRSKHCALLAVKSLCYFMCDTLCEKFDVELQGGRHLPEIIGDSNILSSDSYKISQPARLQPEEKVKELYMHNISVGKSSVFDDSEDSMLEPTLPLVKIPFVEKVNKPSGEAFALQEDAFPPLNQTSPIGRGRGFSRIDRKQTIPGLGRGSKHKE